MREPFSYPHTGNLLALLDEVAQRSGTSRGQAFDDFLHIVVCALSGGQLEDKYLEVIKKYSAGKKGSRACDSFEQMYCELVQQMEHTRQDMRDVLGDLFQGAITYGEAGQFLTPEPLAALTARLQTSNPAGPDGIRPMISDPCCGSGRMLLAIANENRDCEFIGQDIDLRCVRMTAINLAFRNLFGYVVHGNSLGLEKRLAYRTGFNGIGVVREIPVRACPAPVQAIIAQFGGFPAGAPPGADGRLK